VAVCAPRALRPALPAAVAVTALGGPLVCGVTACRGRWVGVTAEALQHLPPGWKTHIGYYVAMHAGSGQGSAVSAGCLRATEAEVR
jgi:hypothetical protein